jgi:hypothetical protein
MQIIGYCRICWQSWDQRGAIGDVSAFCPRCQSPDIRFVIRQRKAYTPRPIPQALPLPEREWWEDQPEFLNDKDDL